MKPAITVKNVYKKFNYWVERPTSLKDYLNRLMKGQINKGSKREISVLEDISFEVHENEFVGIMGRNGAGKSTTLKLITGIYKPTSGSIRTNGRLAPLLELGAGFNPDLSGHENIFLNAALLGFGRRATLAKCQSIIEFSELEEHIHMPVKNYSSGMVIRLGFSIAAHMEADILIFDEVIGVGDAGFKKKCHEKIQELFAKGKTILLVTHSPDTVKRYCSRVIVIDGKKKVYDGPVKEGGDLYLKQCGVAKEIKVDEDFG